MRNWLESLLGAEAASPVMMILAGLALLILLLVALRLLKGLAGGTFVAGGRNRRARLAVMDAAAVDSKRRLVLVRRDEVEHLILIGGPTDIVVEQNIRSGQLPQQPAQPAAAASPPAREPALPEPPRERAAPEQPPQQARPRLVAPQPAPVQPPTPVQPPEPAPAARPAPPSRDRGFFARPERSAPPPPVVPAAAAALSVAPPNPSTAPVAPPPGPTPEPHLAEMHPPREPVIAAPRVEPSHRPAEHRPEPVFEAGPEPEMERHPPAAPVAPAVEADRPALPGDRPAVERDVDDSLLRELEVTLERAERREPEPVSEDAILEDEMSKLLGELSGERR